MPPLVPPSRRSAGAPVLPANAVATASAGYARFWDRIARKYAATPIVDSAGYQTTLKAAQAFLSPDHEVLEIGCGTGTIALQLAPFTRSWLATDISTRMIEIARERLASEAVPQLQFEVAEASDSLSEACAYDVVLAFSVLHLMVDLEYALERSVHSLRPGGLLISKTPCVGEMNPLITRLALPLMRAVGQAPHVLMFSGEALCSAMVRCGLRIVSMERHGTRGKDFRVFIVARKPA